MAYFQWFLLFVVREGTEYSTGVVFDVKAHQKTLWTCDQVEEKPKTDTKKKDGLWVNKEQGTQTKRNQKKEENRAGGIIQKSYPP